MYIYTIYSVYSATAKDKKEAKKIYSPTTVMRSTKISACFFKIK